MFQFQSAKSSMQRLFSCCCRTSKSVELSSISELSWLEDDFLQDIDLDRQESNGALLSLSASILTDSLSLHKRGKAKFMNQYEIQGIIGKGAFSLIYLAVDVNSRYRAIKVIRRSNMKRKSGLGKPTSQRVDYLECVDREIEILSNCKHSAIVKLIEVINDVSSDYIAFVLEWVPCGTILREYNSIDGYQKLKCHFKEIVDGVKYCT